MKQEKKHITLHQLKTVKHLFPNLIEDAEKLKKSKDPSENLTYLELFDYAALCMKYVADGEADERKKLTNVNIALSAAVVPWQYSKLIYRFDEDAAQEILETPLLGIVPVNVFYRLPGWCIYVETPDIDYYDGMVIKGFYAHLNNSGLNGLELRLVFNTNNGVEFSVFPLAEKTIEENLKSHMDKVEEIAGQRSTVTAEDVMPYLTKIITLLIFICTQNDQINRRPTSKGITKRNGFTIENDAVFNDVAIEIGRAIRLNAIQGKSKEGNQGAHKSPRPHIRRAHWHGYWKGSKKEDNQVFELRWLPPFPVAAKDKKDIPATIHKIKK